MKRKNNIHRLWVSLRCLISPEAIFNVLGEIMLRRKMVILGTLLFSIVLVLLSLMTAGILQPSFELLFIALLITVAGTALCLIGCTCYVDNKRA